MSILLLSHYMYDSPRPLRHRNMRDDATAAATGGGGASTTSDGTTASSTAAPSSAASQTASPTVTTTSAASTTATDPEIEDGNWKRLRERHDFHKNRAAVLDSLEGVTEAELPAVTRNWAAITTKANTLAKELGYDDDDFKTAFAQDPFETLRLLQEEKSTKATQSTTTQTTEDQNRKPGETQAEFEKRIDAMVEARTKPYTEHINKQISDQTIAKIGTELTSAIDVALPDAPKEIRDIVNDYVEEYLAGQPAILSTMKSKGDFSAVKEATDFVAGRLKAAFAAWVKSEQTRTAGGGRRTTTAATTARPAGQKPTLDEMIENPELIGEAYR